jgi:ribonuclease HI
LNDPPDLKYSAAELWKQFTRKFYKTESEPFAIKGQIIQPKNHVKILGVIMDAKLKYKEHIARAASKGLEAAMELKRLRGLSPPIARQLFAATVAPVVDYASNVWMHEFKHKAASPMNRIQKIGAQAIIGTFLTRATSIAEAEAHIATTQDRLWRRAIKLWTDIHTLPKTNPLRNATSRMRKFRRFHRSSIYQVADALKDMPMESLETVNPFTLAPWEKRMQTIVDESIAGRATTDRAIRIAVSSSARNAVVGVGGAIEIQTSVQSDLNVETFFTTLGMRSEQNTYSGELAAMAKALSMLTEPRFRSIVLLTRNQAAVFTLRKPRQQSGQEHVRYIYKSISELKKKGNTITVVWLPASEENELMKLAKEKAKMATRQGSTPQAQLPCMRSTTLNMARARQNTTRSLSEKVGRHSKRVDAALPGKHTRRLYDRLSWKEASVLAQLRTGIARLNAYLYRIGAASSDLCECGRARETVEHFLFRCIKWTEHRTEMLKCTDTLRSNISFYLGGKSPSDNEKWTPNMEALRATIRFAITTGRLDADRSQGGAT